MLQVTLKWLESQVIINQDQKLNIIVVRLFLTTTPLFPLKTHHSPVCVVITPLLFLNYPCRHPYKM